MRDTTVTAEEGFLGPHYLFMCWQHSVDDIQVHQRWPMVLDPRAATITTPRPSNRKVQTCRTIKDVASEATESSWSNPPTARIHKERASEFCQKQLHRALRKEGAS